MRSHRCSCILALSVLPALACVDLKFAQDVLPSTPQLTMVVSGPTLGVTPGATIALTVSVTRKNFAGPVALSIDSVPSGVTMTFALDTLPMGLESTEVIISAAKNAVGGTSLVNFRAQSIGVADALFSLPITVNTVGQAATRLRRADADTGRRRD